jgi:hypothetical protein
MARRRSYSINDVSNFKKGTRIGRATGSIAQTTVSGSTRRANNKLAENGSSTSMNGTATELDQSVSMLETIGCCIVSKKEGFSLMDEQTNKDASENPNISGSIGSIKNKQTKADGQFTNPDDPFYDLDSRPSRQAELQNQSIKSTEGEKQIIKIGSDLAALNLSLSGTTLKYFR